MKELKRYLDSRLGEYSFYFEDLNIGYTYSLNENVKMPTASCIKVPIAMTLLKEVENNNLNINEKIMIKKEDMVSGRGFIHEFGERNYTIEELMLAMLMQNDNTATNKLIELIGKDKINEDILSMNLKNTVLARKMMDYEAMEKGIDNCSTSYDLSKCLQMLYKNSYLNEEHSLMLMDLLKKQRNRSKIPFYLPDNEKHSVVNKAGSIDGVENDMALIMIPKGNFVFTVMSKKLPNNVYGIVSISKLGKMMWDIIESNWK